MACIWVLKEEISDSPFTSTQSQKGSHFIECVSTKEARPCGINWFQLGTAYVQIKQSPDRGITPGPRWVHLQVETYWAGSLQKNFDRRQNLGTQGDRDDSGGTCLLCKRENLNSILRTHIKSQHLWPQHKGMGSEDKQWLAGKSIWTNWWAPCSATNPVSNDNHNH